jgi:hypothetical protein
MPSKPRFRAYATRGILSWCALLLSAGPLSAQRLASAFVRPGDRVRVTTYQMASAGERHVGVLHQVFGDSVTVDWTSGVRETLPLHRVSRLEVSDGRGSLIGPGMVAGFLGGAVIGGVAGAASSEVSDPFRGLGVAASTVVGALVGTVSGGLVGAVSRRERWTRVRLDQPLRRVTITPHVLPIGGGTSRVGVQLDIRF